MRTLALPLATLALFLGLLHAPTASAQLVNGSFEPAVGSFSYQLLGGGSTAIPGWTTTDSGVEWFGGPGYPGYAHDGQYLVDLANYVYSAGGVQQTFATSPGQAYEISFWLGSHAVSGRDGTAQIVVSADAQSQTFSISAPSSAVLWQSRTFTFVADDASATLSFRCLQNANLHFAYIDGVGAGTPATPVQSGTWGALKSLYR